MSLSQVERAPPIPLDLPQSGDLVLGQYRIEGVLGAGNIGLVLSAFQATLGRRVALKFVRGAEEDPDQCIRLVREAKAAGRISDPHVITIYDSGFLVQSADPHSWLRAEWGTPFIAMEYLKGVDLDTLMNRLGEPLPMDDVLSYMSAACRGLSAIHRQGTVHRDVKPANLFLAETDSRQSVVKVTDLGVSRFMASGDSDAAPITRPHQLLGSLPYMSPEQVRASSAVSVAADIWSLGVTCYELLTCRLPFEAESEVEILERILNHAPTPAQLFRSDLTPEVINILSRCLHKDPAERYLSAFDLAAALDQARLSLGPKAAPQGTEAPPPPMRSALFRLRALNGDKIDETIPLGEATTIGRSLGIEVSLRDERASRLHARIHLEPDGRYRLEDLSSLNGTTVNGVRIREAFLANGDEVGVGNALYRFEEIEAPPEVRPRAGTLRYGGPDDWDPSPE